MKAQEVVINHNFDASLKSVWQCWSVGDLVSIWYGPGVDTVMHHFEFAEEGYWQEEMKGPQGSLFGRSEFVEIIPGRKIVLHQSSVDKFGNIIANPMMPNWPETVEAQVMFVEAGDVVEMNFRWLPHEASDEEIACFNEYAPKMAMGWKKGFEIMEREALLLDKG